MILKYYKEFQKFMIDNDLKVDNIKDSLGLKTRQAIYNKFNKKHGFNVKDIHTLCVEYKDKGLKSNIFFEI